MTTHTTHTFIPLIRGRRIKKNQRKTQITNIRTESTATAIVINCELPSEVSLTWSRGFSGCVSGEKNQNDNKKLSFLILDLLS